MDLKTFWAVLARRWYLVLLVIACGFAATFFVAVKVGPTFEAKGATLVFPPVATVQRGAETVTQGNPFLALEGVSQARDIVIRELTSKTTADDFAVMFPGSTYEATPDLLNNAPIVALTVEAPSEADAIHGVEDLSGRIPDVLDDLQADLGLDANSLITSRPLAQDRQAESVHKDQIRAAVVAAVVTLGLGLLAIALLDSLLTDRQKKRPAATMSDSPTKNRNGAEQRPESAQVSRAAGANRLRPRSSSTLHASGPVNGFPREDVPELRRSKNGLHSATDPTQRG